MQSKDTLKDLSCEFGCCTQPVFIDCPETGLLLCYQHRNVQPSDVPSTVVRPSTGISKGGNGSNGGSVCSANRAIGSSERQIHAAGSPPCFPRMKRKAPAPIATSNLKQHRKENQENVAPVKAVKNKKRQTSEEKKGKTKGTVINLTFSSSGSDDSDYDAPRQNTRTCSDDSTSHSSEECDGDSLNNDVMSDTEVEEKARGLFQVFCKNVTKSNLARQRAPQRSTSTAVVKSAPRRKMSSECLSDPTTVTPEMRLRELGAIHPLCVSNGKLQCRCCRTPLSTKRSSIKNHMKSKHHEKMLKRYEDDRARRQQMQMLLTAVQCAEGARPEPVLAGGGVVVTPLPSRTLSTATHRAVVCRALMTDMIPLGILRDPTGQTRGLLEGVEGTLPCKDVAAMAESVLKLEFNTVVEEVKASGAAAIAFDGASDEAELFAVTVRYVGPSKTIQHRALAFRLLDDSLKAGELFSLLVQVLFTEAGLSVKSVHYAMRDGCSVNGAALDMLHMSCPQLMDFTCMAHSVNLAGVVFNLSCPIAHSAVCKLSALGVRSRRFRRRFYELAGQVLKKLSKTRWFCEAELARQLYEKLSSVLEALEDDTIAAKEMRTELLGFLNGNSEEVQLELALLYEAASPMGSLCYLANRDGFVAPLIYNEVLAVLRRGDEITARRHGVPVEDAQPRAERVEVVLRDLHGDDLPLQRQLLAETAAKAVAPYQKLAELCNGRLQDCMRGYRACRLLDFRWVAQQVIEAVDDEVIQLAFFPHLRPIVPDLHAELPAYHARAVAAAAAEPADAPRDEVTLWAFWRRSTIELPMWFRAAAEVALVMTSSGSVERMFAMYEGGHSDHQQSMLQDRREGSVMLRFNAVQRSKEQ